MKTRAAVMFEANRPLEIAEVELDSPRDREVLVQVKASGVCHSDWNNLKYDGTPLPTILGHEGAGVVIEVGKEVSHVRPGDSVILSWLPYCRHCFFCADAGQPQFCDTIIGPMFEGTLLDRTTRFTIGDRPVHHYSFLSTFSEYTVVPADSCIRMPSEMPYAQASLIGCGVATGYGAAANSAQVREGGSIAVFGVGGVGVGALQAAKIAGAKTVIAVDLKPANLERARLFGATHTLSPQQEDYTQTILELSHGRGVDCAVDTTGSVQACRQAVDSTRKGGTVAVVGTFMKPELVLTAPGFHRVGKSIRGSFYGDVDPHRDFPKLVELYLKGSLQLDDLILEKLELKDINKAFELFSNPEAVNIGRSVVLFS